MQYLNIKGLAKPVSNLFLGTAWITPACKKDADAVIARYIALGGNVLDTGRFYAGGKTEDYLKVWIKENPELRSKIMFTSKGCHHFVDENNIHYPDQKRVTPEFIEEDLHFSLNNMGIDYFDIYMLHRDDVGVPVSVLMDSLEKCYKEGFVKTYGVSNWSIERIQEAQQYCKAKGYQGISVNSCSYSLAKVTKPRWGGTIYADDAYAKWCTDNDLLILSWGAQGNGFFGNYPFPKGVRVTQDYVDAFANTENFEKFRRVKELADLHGVSMTNIAFAYILNQNLKMVGIIGPRNERELIQAMAGAQITLAPEEIEYLSLRSN